MSDNNYSKRYKTNKYKIIKIIGIVVLALLVVFFVYKFAIGVSAVDGNSMYPTYNDGQLVFFNRLNKDYKTGDVVAMNHLDNNFYIKRIVAVAGDVVDIKDGQVYVNGELSPYGDGTTANATSGNVVYPYTVPEDSVFVMGDNRGTDPETGGLYSIDSRTFGAVGTGQLLGIIF